MRDIVRRTGVAGLIVDHTTRGSAALISRGATAKFNALDVSFGVRLADLSVPSPSAQWSSIVSIEKDLHGLLTTRADRAATFTPLAFGTLHVDLVELDASTHRLSGADPQAVVMERLESLDPPPTSGNDAHRRIGGNRRLVLDAYKRWSESGTTGTAPKGGYRVPVSSTANTGTGTAELVPLAPQRQATA